METRQLVLALATGAILWAAAPPAVEAQSAIGRPDTRLRTMDRDGDGVITRAEWRGSAQAFRERDRNGDGVLSGDEVLEVGPVGTSGNAADIVAEFRRIDRNGDGVVSRSEWRGDRETFDRVDRDRNGEITTGEFVGEGGVDTGTDLPAFNTLDRNGNGVITPGEWNASRTEFQSLDTDGDGVLTRREYRQSGGEPSSPAWRAGRERGLTNGRQAGREDRTINGAVWDLDGQRELETADAGYNPSVGSREEYQAGYRAGFRAGYREGFGPRK